MSLALVVPFFLAMFPILERYAISVAILEYHLNLPTAYFVVLLGNMLPVIAIVYLLGPLTDLFSKYSKAFKKVFEAVCRYSRNKNAKRFEALKDLAILVIAALPIPLMGTWSGALAAFIFDVPPAKSIPLIFAGAIISNTVVALTAKGITLFF
jgi:uncharacterized membrane protein